MFHIMRNGYISETKLVDTVVREIRGRLPSQWALLNRGEMVRVGQVMNRSRMIDAILEIRDPQGLSTSIVVDVKGTPVEPNRVSFAAEMLLELTRLVSEEDGELDAAPVPMMLSPFLSPLARERLVAADISYADSTGNLRLSADKPAIFIETQGRTRILSGKTVPFDHSRADVPHAQSGAFSIIELLSELASSPAKLRTP